MVSIGYDISKFNEYVNRNVDQLSAHGEESSDLMMNVFKGYKNAKDSNFVTYIVGKQNAYDESIGTPPFTVGELMVSAENYYKGAILNKTWNAPSDAEKQIEVLTTLVSKLKHTTKKQKGANHGKKQKDSAGKKEKRSKPKWLKSKEPPADKNETKTWGKNTYQFCGAVTGGKCEGWRVHKPSKCKGKGHRFLAEKKRAYNEDTQRQKKKLKLTAAYSAVAEKDKQDASDSE